MIKRPFFTKLIPAFLVFFLLGSLFATPALALEIETVTVTGRGAVIAPADGAEIGFSLEGRGASKDDAVRIADRSYEAVAKVAKALGTLRLESHCTYKDCSTGDYCVSRYYTLVMKKPQEAPIGMERLIATGAVCVNPPCYYLHNRSEWEKKALAIAIEDAEARAEACGAAEKPSALFDRGNDALFCCGNPDGTVTVTCTVTLTYRR